MPHNLTAHQPALPVLIQGFVPVSISPTSTLIKLKFSYLSHQPAPPVLIQGSISPTSTLIESTTGAPQPNCTSHTEVLISMSSTSPPALLKNVLRPFCSPTTNLLFPGNPSPLPHNPTTHLTLHMSYLSHQPEASYHSLSQEPAFSPS